MAEILSVPASAVIARIQTALSGQIVPEGGKHILVACMPKSASTYLTGLIKELPGMNLVTLTYGHHRREQELCPLACALAHEVNYVAKAHVRYSDATQNIMRQYGIFPVILIRNIYDCIVSLRDHLVHESLDIPQAFVPRDFRRLAVRDQYDFIIDFIVPWYASFFASWVEHDGPSVVFPYERLIQDFPAAVAKIMEAAGVETSRRDIDAAISKVDPKENRFNVGRVGRGIEQLSGRQIKGIRHKFSFFKALPGLTDILEH
jgi:hypothetical protein